MATITVRKDGLTILRMRAEDLFVVLLLHDRFGRMPKAPYEVQTQLDAGQAETITVEPEPEEPDFSDGEEELVVPDQGRATDRLRSLLRKILGW